MSLERDEAGIAGTYHYGGTEGRLVGIADGDTLKFSYNEANQQGEGFFRLLRSGKFCGGYTTDGDNRVRRWEGERGWDGIWQSNFGRVRLMHEAERVHGFYEGAGPSRIDGKSREGRYEFRFIEPKASGEGWFQMSDDGGSFDGQWRAGEGVDWAPWTGHRLRAEPGTTWLVVFEAHWQRGLSENEYAYGNMLREVFARLPNVRVRQRFFHDTQGLEQWCRELIFLPEPAIVMIASHGVADGLRVQGQLINTTRVLANLRHAENLMLLHFSSCLVGQDGEQALAKQPYPVSGYATSVDWGASTLLELAYLDLILNRRMDPAEAAATLPAALSFAGDSVSEGSPYRAAGFRFYPSLPLIAG